ncbi:hypothetical protein [Fibrisoma limi]|uniref:hypothetical protein n=1 Tax=Fibrisoma limi TaxID=663275 RepID=UPI0002FB96CA|nr:hypothetical protein [Fibrisoma limi]
MKIELTAKPSNDAFDRAFIAYIRKTLDLPFFSLSTRTRIIRVVEQQTRVKLIGESN